MLQLQSATTQALKLWSSCCDENNYAFDRNVGSLQQFYSF